MSTIAAFTGRILELFTVGLLLVLAGVVVSAVFARYVLNSSFPWYDEVASVLLAWITYFGAALAALRRSHLGFSGLVLSLPLPARSALFVLAEVIVLAVFLAMAYAGWYVLRVMEGETLVSLDWVPLSVTQSVLPIGCALFVLCSLFSLPKAWQDMRTGRSAEDEEIDQELAKARVDDAGTPSGP